MPSSSNAGPRLSTVRLKYYFAGCEKLIGLGSYADVSFTLARERRHEARRLVAAGGDPSAEQVAQAETFEAIAREWLESKVGAKPWSYRRK